VARLLIHLLSILLIASGAVGNIDTNNNKIDDSLEFGLHATADAGVDVIVLYDQVHDPPPAGSRVKYDYGIIDATALRIPRSRLHELAEGLHVEMVYPDRVVHTQLDSSVPVIRADRARDAYNLTGRGVTIAILDTGIDAAHESLDDLDDDPATDDPKVIAFKDFVGSQTEPYDDDGHGTHCAGIAAGNGGNDSEFVGVAPGANLVGVKVLDREGYGDDSDVIAGLDWCLLNKDAYEIRIISMSLGDDNNTDGTTLLEQACDAAVDGGIVVCVAAGNDGSGNATVGDPACAKKVITVGSVDDSMTIAPSSSRGPTADGRIKPEVCAVGVSVVSARAGGGYTTMSGTSMATPHVAGAAALILEHNPDLVPPGVREILMDAATYRGTSGPDNDYGWGVVNTTYAISIAIQERGISVLEIGAPRYAEPNRTVTIDATIRNIGLCNESNVTVFLLLDGAELNHTTIPSIRTKDTIDVEFSWLPEMAGVYNLSVYASPVDNETLLDDNARCIWINVSRNPDIWIEPASYDFTLRPNSSVVVNLTIGNSGTLPLSFDIGLPRYSMESIQHRWIDGISGGTDLDIGDDEISNQNLPFVFNFYGRDYTAVNISSDGWVSFTSGDKWLPWMYDRGPILPVGGWANTIFPLGDDWDPGSGGGVYAKSYSQMYVITWHQVSHWYDWYDGGSTGNNTFEMVLYKTGEIEFNYKKIDNPETFAVGLNLGDGLHGISCENEPQNMTALRFKPEEWLSVGTENGTVPADGEIDITIGIDTTELNVGSYSADILIRSNDPDEGSITIPVDLLVRRSWSATDAVIALDVALGSREYDPAMDVNGDGQITSLDALMILQAAAGNIGM